MKVICEKGGGQRQKRYMCQNSIRLNYLAEPSAEIIRKWDLALILGNSHFDSKDSTGPHLGMAYESKI